jgi:hypothetical protein
VRGLSGRVRRCHARPGRATGRQATSDGGRRDASRVAFAAVDGTLIGIIIGSALVIVYGSVTEVLRGRRESLLDRQKRADDRQLAREAFQREQLQSLQPALVAWARASVEHQLVDRAAYRASGEWHKNLVGPEVSEREQMASLNLTMLRSRIADEELYERLSVCQDLWVGLLATSTPDDAASIERDLA